MDSSVPARSTRTDETVLGRMGAEICEALAVAPPVFSLSETTVGVTETTSTLSNVCSVCDIGLTCDGCMGSAWVASVRLSPRICSMAALRFSATCTRLRQVAAAVLTFCTEAPSNSVMDFSISRMFTLSLDSSFSSTQPTSPFPLSRTPLHTSIDSSRNEERGSRICERSVIIERVTNASLSSVIGGQGSERQSEPYFSSRVSAVCSIRVVEYCSSNGDG
mmetsp:Transcript_8896/g.17421  ORF Transcript_8896/g.17421 Transcript_8896/m.17421 type:complete len:220 (-) Transcript_8896:359-1018(-)